MPRTNPARYTDPLRGTRTKQEAGRLIGCGDHKVDELIDNGSLVAITVGNRRLPTVASLELLLGRSITEMEAPLREPMPARREARAAKREPRTQRKTAREAAATPLEIAAVNRNPASP